MAAAPSALNAICPYFTMFPLEFPLRILKSRAQPGDRVLDPFCGRGTTNFAARLTGLRSLGVDSSPVAAAITASKLAVTCADDVVDEARRILARGRARRIPEGEFWRWGFDPAVLERVCRLREALRLDCESPARIALRGIALGALHGPRQKHVPGYFSNQSPRTYSPKPGYAVRFWKKARLVPPPNDVLAVIERRAKRFYGASYRSTGTVRLGDSRSPDVFKGHPQRVGFDWVITSPPYYGLRTYLPDQWLRHWFLGGPDTVDYGSAVQLNHESPQRFASDLRQVWCNAERVCRNRARLVIRFGGIADRQVEPLALLRGSLQDTGWTISHVRPAGSASAGKRQADAFLRTRSRAIAEYDVWAIKQ